MYVQGAALDENVRSVHSWFQDQTGESLRLLFYICLWRLLPAFILMTLIRSIGNYYLLYGVVFLFGVSFGYTLSLLSIVYGMRSIILMIAYMFPQYLIYIPMTMTAVHFADRQMSQTYPPQFSRTLAIYLLIFVGCFPETYVNPWVLKLIIKNFSW